MRRVAAITLLMLVCLVGCSANTGDGPSSGEPLTPEQQEALYEQRLEEQGEQDVESRAVVYWTPSGTKYHKDSDCSYIKNAKQLQSGTVAQAINHGAQSPCSRCAQG